MTLLEQVKAAIQQVADWPQDTVDSLDLDLPALQRILEAVGDAGPETVKAGLKLAGGAYYDYPYSVVKVPKKLFVAYRATLDAKEEGK